jgi:hypothetical protein
MPAATADGFVEVITVTGGLELETSPFRCSEELLELHWAHRLDGF